MDIYSTEDEQVEKVKKWLKEYGPTVFISLVIVVSATFGLRYWRGKQEQIRQVASASYEQMLISSMNKDEDATKLQAQELIKQYAHTPYAKLAALLLAKMDISHDQYGAAKKQLQWVITHADTAAIHQVALDRKARILIAQEKPQQALTLLSKVVDPGFKAIVEKIRGDAQLALGNKKAARNSYQLALDASPNKAANRPILKMKFNDLAAS